jgi:hypothetical protein
LTLYPVPALSTFNWISWIAPDNVSLNNIVGGVNGLGLNPIPTFDFNNLTAYSWNPLVIPFFSTLNQFIGMMFGFVMIVAFYWTNVYNTSYLPINSNHVFDHTGKAYNISRAIDSHGLLDNTKYQAYSMPWMSAGNLTIYFWFFAVYSSTISYAILFHRHEISMGFQGLWRQIRRRGRATEAEDDLADDIHVKLMRSYKEVPEWWYLIVLLIAVGCGMAGIGAWETYTNPAVVLFGIALALVFIIPVGIISAVTGIQVTMNVSSAILRKNLTYNRSPLTCPGARRVHRW